MLLASVIHLNSVESLNSIVILLLLFLPLSQGQGTSPTGFSCCSIVHQDYDFIIITQPDTTNKIWGNYRAITVIAEEKEKSLSLPWIVSVFHGANNKSFNYQYNSSPTCSANIIFLYWKSFNRIFPIFSPPWEELSNRQRRRSGKIVALLIGVIHNVGPRLLLLCRVLTRRQGSTRSFIDIALSVHLLYSNVAPPATRWWLPRLAVVHDLAEIVIVTLHRIYG